MPPSDALTDQDSTKGARSQVFARQRNGLDVFHGVRRVVAAILLLAPIQAYAGPPAQPADATKSTAAPTSLVITFDLNSSRIRKEDEAVLDRVSRVFNDGKPIVMTLAASSDTAGNARANLLLSQRRAAAVYRGLLDRGLPADHFQLVANGQTDLAVPTGGNVREARNRRVVISWR